MKDNYISPQRGITKQKAARPSRPALNDPCNDLNSLYFLSLGCRWALALSIVIGLSSDALLHLAARAGAVTQEVTCGSWCFSHLHPIRRLDGIHLPRTAGASPAPAPAFCRGQIEAHSKLDVMKKAGALLACDSCGPLPLGRISPFHFQPPPLSWGIAFNLPVTELHGIFMRDNYIKNLSKVCFLSDIWKWPLCKEHFFAD